MASRPRPTHLKREREKAKQQRRQEKVVKRQEAAGRKSGQPTRSGNFDPDLDGIVAGPQPLQDWQIEEENNE